MKALKSLILIVVLVVLAAVIIFGGTDTRLRLTYIILGIGFLTFLGSSLYSIVSNAKQNVKGLVGGGGLIAMIVLFYFIAPRNDVPVSQFEKTGTSLSWDPIIGAGLYSIYALLAIFVVSFIVLSIRNSLK
ncbi:MAG: hypothetical protein JXR53_01545 [Bacteroidales bacterium]|nr:hypothetical protein [Bacteroidales bacterium]